LDLVPSHLQWLCFKGATFFLISSLNVDANATELEDPVNVFPELQVAFPLPLEVDIIDCSISDMVLKSSPATTLQSGGSGAGSSGVPDSLQLQSLA